MSEPPPLDGDRPTVQELLRLTNQGLHIYEAVVAAQVHWDDVMLILANTNSRKAKADIAVLLGTDNVGAEAVLDLQLRRRTPKERARIVARRDEMLSHHDDLVRVERAGELANTQLLALKPPGRIVSIVRMNDGVWDIEVDLVQHSDAAAEKAQELVNQVFGESGAGSFGVSIAGVTNGQEVTADEW